MSRRVIILGVGNAILRDDGVGVLAVRSLSEEATRAGIDTAEAEVAGFALIDLLSGYDAAVVIDAVRLPGLEPGDVTVLDVERMAPSLHMIAGHQIDLPTALALGREVGAHVPSPGSVHVVGVQVLDDRTFSEEPTPAVAAAIPEATRTALELALAELEDGPR